MPLHPSLVIFPFLLAALLAAADLWHWRRPSADARRAAALINILSLVACLAAVTSGEAEGGRIATSPELVSLMERHDQVATAATFLAGGLLLIRGATWRSNPPWGKRVLASGSVLLLLLLLAAGRLGGRLVFEHGAGVRASYPGFPVPAASALTSSTSDRRSGSDR